MSSLEDVLLSEYEAPEEVPDDDDQRQQLAQRFRIQDTQQAIWALRKIIRIRRQRDAVFADADAQIAKIRDWVQAETARLDREERWFTSLLHVFHLDLLREEPKRKTIKLPGGRLSLRAQQPKFERDDVTLIAWLKDNNLTQFVRVVEEPDWAELKKRIETRAEIAIYADTGEVVPGVTVYQRPLLFKVTTEEVGKGATTDSPDS